MDSRQVLARFEAERQALALMEHPNIAKVLDAGRTPSGRPYFVMELVKGKPITQYCDDKRLGVRERLELFGDVCRAVQHAHQKGIIHRDLKPSNVLVAPYDGKPVVKVIDFGVAKATGQRLTDKTLFTGFGALVGTPEYMSPEQAEVNNQDIDTRSDIYALGVVLYELLTGSTPLTRKWIKEAALLEVLRVIREEEPPRPSTRLSDSKESLPAISAQRQTEPARLTRLVRGELDWIVMKALEKDRNRRYETANGFALDVQRYLADEPVLACPPSAWYRCRKFARRHKGRLAFAAGTCLLVAAVLGSAVWAVRDRALREEEKQREQAARQARAANELELALGRAELFQEQGKRAEALAALERAEVLAGEATDPAQDGRRIALKERLDAQQRDQQFRTRFEEIRLEAQTQVNIGESRFSWEAAYPEIREALARYYGINVGDTDPALAAARILGRPEPTRRELLAALGVCLQWTPATDGRVRRWLHATLTAGEADPWRAQALQAWLDGNVTQLEQLARAVDVRQQPPSFLVFVAWNLPCTKPAAQLELLRRTQRAYPADLWANHDLAMALVHGGQPAEAIRYYTAALVSRPNNAGIYVNRGEAFFEAGEVDEAIADFREAAALVPSYFMAHYNLGVALRDKRKVDEAITCFQNAISLNPKYAPAHSKLGLALFAQGRLDEAIAEFREASRLKPDDAGAHVNLGTVLKANRQLDEAIAAYRQAIHIEKDYAEAHTNLGNALKAKGQLDEAIAEFREAIRLKKDLPQAHNNLGNALQAKGQVDEAIAAHREAIRIKEDFAEAHYNLGNALRNKGQLDEAIAAYQEAIRLKKDYAQAHVNLGIALRQKGQLDEAIAAFREATRLKKGYAKAHYYLGDALARKGQLDEAIASFREAIRLKNDLADVHYDLATALARKGQLDEAIAAYREAIRLKNDDALAHYDLGNALRVKGQLDEAIAAYREAIQLKNDYAEAYCNLGLVLRDQGRFRDALAALQKGHKLGSQQPGWRYPSAAWLAEVEQLIELDAKLAKVLKREDPLANAHERLRLASFCQKYKKLYTTAAAWYVEAFAAEPKAAEDLKAGHRYHAACAAALAGSGKGHDAGQLSDDERSHFRQQALEWLRAELAIYAKRLPAANAQDRTWMHKQLEHWQRQDDLRGLRDATALAQLAADERAAWLQLWVEVATVLRETGGANKE
jgi:tetratricopeptide (TPR) repeat protein